MAKDFAVLETNYQIAINNPWILGATCELKSHVLCAAIKAVNEQISSLTSWAPTPADLHDLCA